MNHSQHPPPVAFSDSDMLLLTQTLPHQLAQQPAGKSYVFTPDPFDLAAPARAIAFAAAPRRAKRKGAAGTL